MKIEVIGRAGAGSTDHTPVRQQVTLACSFCGKHEVDVLVAGPLVWICDECVALCVDIVAEARALRKKSKAKKRWNVRRDR